MFFVLFRKNTDRPGSYPSLERIRKKRQVEITLADSLIAIDAVAAQRHDDVHCLAGCKLCRALDFDPFIS